MDNAEIERIINNWKQQNPDWRAHAGQQASRNDPDYIRQQRQEIHEGAASLLISALVRNVIHHGMDPRNGYPVNYMRSLAITHQRERNGQHLPFHQEMEQHLTKVVAAADRHFGYFGSDVVTKVEKWFDTNIRQPVTNVLGSNTKAKSSSWW